MLAVCQALIAWSFFGKWVIAWLFQSVFARKKIFYWATTAKIQSRRAAKNQKFELKLHARHVTIHHEFENFGNSQIKPVLRLILDSWLSWLTAGPMNPRNCKGAACRFIHDPIKGDGLDSNSSFLFLPTFDSGKHLRPDSLITDLRSWPWDHTVAITRSAVPSSWSSLCDVNQWCWCRKS